MPVSRRRSPARALPLALLLLALTAACGGSGDSGDADPAQPASPSATAAGSGSAACQVAVSGAAGAKPEVRVPTGCPAPTTLQVRDVIPGSGTPLAAGRTAVVQYVGASWSTGRQFDASWDRGQPYPVQNVGQAQVIEGWNQGLVGMRPGARRLLVIPPGLGYGAQGAGEGVIAPNETLVFVVDLVEIAG